MGPLRNTPALLLRLAPVLLAPVLLAPVLSGCGAGDGPVSPAFVEDAPDAAPDAGQVEPDEGAPPEDPGPGADDPGAPSDQPEPPADTADEPDAQPDADAGASDSEDADDGGAPDLPADDPGPPPPPPYWEDLPPGYEQAHFEALAVGFDGWTEDFAAIAPPGSVSFAVMVSGAPKDVYMRVGTLVTPKGHPIVKGQGNVLCITCPNRVHADQLLTTTLVPNSPEVEYESKGGKYKLALMQFTVSPIGGVIVVSPWHHTDLTARILFKVHEGEPAAGTMDLNLFFTGAAGVTAELAPTNDRIMGMLAELSEIYAQAGIGLGEVRYFDAPEDAPTGVETSIGVDSDLSKLFATSAGAPPGVNLFFVSTIVKTELADGSTAVVLGIAGGIPGPPWLSHGTIHSGVAVSLLDTDSEPDLLGSVVAHELGHYLGLYHSTEQTNPDAPDSTTHDPIADTELWDATNLMWWMAEGGKTLTPGQGFVMLRHPSIWLAP